MNIILLFSSLFIIQSLQTVIEKHMWLTEILTHLYLINYTSSIACKQVLRDFLILYKSQILLSRPVTHRTVKILSKSMLEVLYLH